MSNGVWNVIVYFSLQRYVESSRSTQACECGTDLDTLPPPPS